MKAPDPFLSVSFSLVIYLGYLALSFHRLPLHMASHFDLQGQADGWMNRGTYLGIMTGVGLSLPIVVSLVMGLVTRLPLQLVNLPNREYWLATERRGSTGAVLFRYALWFSALNLLFLTGIAWLVVQANALDAENHLSGLGLTLIAGGFLLATGLGVRSLSRQFLRTG
jgi:hypothetical protein